MREEAAVLCACSNGSFVARNRFRLTWVIVHVDSSVDAAKMAPELEFSFVALNGSARRHIRVFQIHQFLDRFAMGLTVAVFALALTELPPEIRTLT
ncbi:hypothetical protein [Kordiimonas sp.]|uniref:hypothetical protein n=1 Tax=Kordiimonas sp. TaxID=1970157 RepID=UPI003A8D5838